MVYPVRQRWFASRTQMANEPTYVDEGERISSAKIYYHAGLDIIFITRSSAGRPPANSALRKDMPSCGKPTGANTSRT